MKNLTLTLCALFISITGLSYAEAVCKKCQLVREFNEKNPSKYEFYEDYLKDKEAGIAEDIQFTDDKIDFEKIF